MKTLTYLACLMLCGFLTAAVPAADDASFVAGKWFACGDYSGKKIFLVGPDGKVAWEYASGVCNDLWVLPSGNFLMNTGCGVREVTRDKQVVFDYQSQSEIYACQRLANGNTFVGECNSGRLLELAPDGRVVKQLRLLPEGADGGHVYMRNARQLATGNYLVTHYGEEKVSEYDPQGKCVWTVPAPGGPHTAVRLPDGHTLIATGDKRKDPRLLEVDAQARMVWELSNQDLPGAPLRFLTGFQRLPNGNTLVSNWLGHGQFGQASHLLEVAPDKHVVWSYANHTDMRTISAVQVLDAEGHVLPGEILR